MSKSPDAFKTISEVAEVIDVPQHVLRFWETKFAQIKPMKRAGGRRYYRPNDVELIKGIRELLHGDGYTIKGVQRILKDQGVRYVIGIGRNGLVETVPVAAKDVNSEAEKASLPVDTAPAPSVERDGALSDAQRLKILAVITELETMKAKLAAARAHGQLQEEAPLLARATRA